MGSWTFSPRTASTLTSTNTLLLLMLMPELSKLLTGLTSGPLKRAPKEASRQLSARPPSLETSSGESRFELD